jgi:glycine hydroxymethyltransferase
MRDDFDNPWGHTNPKGEVRKMTALLDMGVFPGTQGGPLEHIIAAKAIAFEECLSDEYMEYILQVKLNASIMADEFVSKDFKLISGGTDNHSMLIDLRNKNLTGKIAEETLGKVDITINKNMVPFDTKSPFVTSGMRIGTPAITTRGLKEADMKKVVSLIDRALMNYDNDAELAKIKSEVNSWMVQFPLY